MRKKYSISFIVMVMAFMLQTMNAFAAEKKVEIPLQKNYNACIFKITYEQEFACDTVLVGPNGEEYVCETTLGKTKECEVSPAYAGTYNVVTTSDEVTDIGKVNVTVEATQAETTNEVSNIQIAKDIAGLAIYFVDDAVAVEWTDDSVGDVYVTVTNIDNNEVIGSEKVDGKEYLCDIPAGVKKILVSVVPASSSTIDSAVQKYTFDFINQPDAIVTYPEYDITNMDSVPVKVLFGETYGIEVLNNGMVVLEKDDMGSGEHIVDIPVSNPFNDVKLYVIDESGNKRSYSYNVTYDNISPTLTFPTEYDGLTTTEDNYTITGSVSDYDTLYLNDADIKDMISTDGTFTINCDLHDGVNTYVVKATDKAGNEASYPISIEKVVETKEFPVQIIFIAVVLIFILVINKMKKNVKFTLKNNKDIKAVQKVDEDESDDRYSEDNENTEYDDDEDIEDEMNVDNNLKKLLIKKNEMQGVSKSFVFTLVICACIFVIGKFVVTPCYVVSGSMEPTIMTGDLMFCNDLSYVSEEPQRGDVIAFNSREFGKVYTKRIVAVGGDKVSFKNGYLYINDEKVDEREYLDEDIETNCVKSFEVPYGTVFCLGDNRENSLDSRYFENPYIPIEDILGKQLAVLKLSTIF